MKPEHIVSSQKMILAIMIIITNHNTCRKRRPERKDDLSEVRHQQSSEHGGISGKG